MLTNCLSYEYCFSRKGIYVSNVTNPQITLNLFAESDNFKLFMGVFLVNKKSNSHFLLQLNYLYKSHFSIYFARCNSFISVYQINFFDNIRNID